MNLVAIVNAETEKIHLSVDGQEVMNFWYEDEMQDFINSRYDNYHLDYYNGKGWETWESEGDSEYWNDEYDDDGYHINDHESDIDIDEGLFDDFDIANLTDEELERRIEFHLAR